LVASVNPQLAIDSHGLPVLAYSDKEKEYNPMVKRFDGINWNAMGANGCFVGVTYGVGLAISPADVPAVIFRDIENSNKATVVKTSFDP
jgi:hypothetical protein